MRARRRKPAKSELQRETVARPGLSQPDLQTLNRGLFGLEQADAGREAEAAAEGSMQDPLQDWPEAEGERDRWLLERDAQQADQEER
jgi:hypothetical protein